MDIYWRRTHQCHVVPFVWGALTIGTLNCHGRCREYQRAGRFVCGTVCRVIRDVVAADLPLIWAINNENVPAVGEESHDALARIVDQSVTALVAEVDDTLAGFCLVVPPGTDYDSPNYRYFCDRYDDFIYLDRVAITVGHRGKGLGAALYREVERRASAQWFTLEVNVVPPNEGSMRFHLREGFREVEQRETRPGKIVSLMVKELAGAAVTVPTHD